VLKKIFFGFYKSHPIKLAKNCMTTTLHAFLKGSFLAKKS